MKASLVGLVALALLLATGCGAGPAVEPDDGRPADYVAVPDEELFDAIRSLPDVDAADVRYVNQISEANTYRAVVLLEPGADEDVVGDVFDQVVQVLRHGRWAATTIVTVRSGDVARSGDGRDPETAEEYDRVHGPQTGRVGWPPAFVAPS